MFTDRTIICKDCGGEFIFTAGEQEFYAEKGFSSGPSRCRNCRQSNKNERRQKTVMYEIVCSKCGKVEAIPFEPRHDRPVFCGECYKERHSKF